MLWATFTPDDSRSGVKVEGIGDVCKDMLDKMEEMEEMCGKCKGEGEVGGYLDDACTCCTEGGCGPGTGCGCWHQGEVCDHCDGMGVESTRT